MRTVPSHKIKSFSIWEDTIIIITMLMKWIPLADTDCRCYHWEDLARLCKVCDEDFSPCSEKKRLGGHWRWNRDILHQVQDQRRKRWGQLMLLQPYNNNIVNSCCTVVTLAGHADEWVRLEVHEVVMECTCHKLFQHYSKDSATPNQLTWKMLDTIH